MQSHPSPNFGPRKNGLSPSIVVIHYTAMASAGAALARLCDPAAEVSAHYLIDRTGVVTQMVDENARAWHAGHGEWRGQDDINSRSIGIELDNSGHQPFSEPLMAALETLLTGILSRYDIDRLNVIGHSDMAPGRKQDPGARFDWARLARGSLAAPSTTGSPAAPDPAVFRTNVRAAGMTADCDDDVLLAAFRLRHRPGGTGPLAEADMAMAAGCAEPGVI